MNDIVCELLLPAHGAIIYSEPKSKSTGKQVSKLLSSFGPINVSLPSGKGDEITYDFTKHRWLNDKGATVKNVDLELVRPVLQSRVSQVSRSLAVFVSSHKHVARAKAVFLHPSPPPSPRRTWPFDNWRKQHTHWLTERVADGDRLTRSEPFGPQERRFRAAVELLASIPRPFSISFTLCRSECKSTYLAQMKVPAETRQYGFGFKVDGARITVDKDNTTSPAEHGNALILSYLAAFVCALGRFAPDADTILDLDILLQQSDITCRAGSFVTHPGAWVSLLDLLPGLETADLDRTDGLDITLDI